MKSITHHNKQVLVNFPNGEARTRNCITTIMPDVRRKVKSVSKSTSDVYSRTDYRNITLNSFRKSEATKEQSNRIFEHAIAGALIAFALYIFFTV